MATAPASMPQVASTNGSAKANPPKVNVVERAGANESDSSPTSEGETLAMSNLTMRSSLEKQPAFPKISILRDTTTRVSTLIKTRLGSAAEEVFGGSQTFDDFLDALENERLRHMPHDGSEWDKVLRWAESFAEYMYMFHESVKSFMEHSEEATRLIWGSCLSLLQVSML